jgi:hypothetical protein
MDIRMPGMDGLTATRLLTAAADGPRILVLTTFDLDAYVFEASRAGASGFLLKDARPDDLLAAIRVIAAGEGTLAPRSPRRRGRPASGGTGRRAGRRSVRGEHGNPVAEQQRLVDVVGDEHDGRRGSLEHVDEQSLHGGPGLRVEVAERFVQEHRPRRHGECTGELHPLPHAAGELAGSRPSCPDRPTLASHSVARSRRRFRRTPRIASGSSTLRRAVRHGSSVSSWKTSARSGDGPRTGTPSARIVPLCRHRQCVLKGE